MLVSLTRETFEQIIPIIATGPQYGYYWGKWSDFLRRLLISVVALTVTWLVGLLFGPGGFTIKIILDSMAGLYWLWSPVYLASIKNNTYRRIPYAGFWRGRVLDAFITEELISEEETVNQRGDLVIIENVEKRINLVVGDQSGFKITVQAPLRRIYKGIRPGAVAELLVLSQQPDLETISQVTDVYLPQQNIWVGEYPYLRRDVFKQVSQELGGSGKSSTNERRPGSYIVKRKSRN